MLFIQGILLIIISTFANHSVADTVSLWAVIGVCLLAKLLNSASFMIVYLQAAEIYPTSIRTTGMGFVYFAALVLGLPAPYIVDMGKQDKSIPYIFLGALGIFSSITSSFLPETLGCYLPETLVGAANFGRDQKYFSMKVVTKKNEDDKNAVSEDGVVEYKFQNEDTVTMADPISET